MTDKYLLFDLSDEKAKNLGDVISNATSRKIANLLADKEMSESDIAKELGFPLNTIDYNVKKLVEAGIIEKSKNHLWSEKGKKIENYKIANKLIVISPKKSNVYSKLKGIVPIILVSVIFTALILYLQLGSIQVSQDSGKLAAVAPAAETAASSGSAGVGDMERTVSNPNYLMWILAGVWVVVLVFIAYSLWKKD